MNETDLKIIPYTATSLSVVGRFIFMFLLYRNKSTNSLSLIFCILSICSKMVYHFYTNCTCPDNISFVFSFSIIYFSFIFCEKAKL